MFQFDVRSMTLDDYNMMTMTIFDDVPRDYSVYYKLGVART